MKREKREAKREELAKKAIAFCALLAVGTFLLLLLGLGLGG